MVLVAAARRRGVGADSGGDVVTLCLERRQEPAAA
jgi:hypothetical protein